MINRPAWYKTRTKKRQKNGATWIYQRPNFFEREGVKSHLVWGMWFKNSPCTLVPFPCCDISLPDIIGGRRLTQQGRQWMRRLGVVYGSSIRRKDDPSKSGSEIVMVLTFSITGFAAKKFLVSSRFKRSTSHNHKLEYDGLITNWFFYISHLPLPWSLGRNNPHDKDLNHIHNFLVQLPPFLTPRAPAPFFTLIWIQQKKSFLAFFLHRGGSDGNQHS